MMTAQLKMGFADEIARLEKELESVREKLASVMSERDRLIDIRRKMTNSLAETITARENARKEAATAIRERDAFKAARDRAILAQEDAERRELRLEDQLAAARKELAFALNGLPAPAVQPAAPVDPRVLDLFSSMFDVLERCSIGNLYGARQALPRFKQALDDARGIGQQAPPSTPTIGIPT